LAQAGRDNEAHALFARLKPVIRMLFQEPSPGPVKQVLAAQGFVRNELRLPMTPASDALWRRLRRALAQLPSDKEVAALYRRRDC